MMKGDDSIPVDIISYDIDPELSELLNTLYPIPSLRQLAFSYHMIMETNDGLININNCKRFFQLELRNYEEADMQRFNLTCCSNDQVMASFADPQVEDTMNTFAELTLQQFLEVPGSLLLRLSHENEISDIEIKNKVDEFLRESLKGLSNQEALIMGSIILISDNNACKYIYTFNIDTPTKTIKIYRTKGRKPVDDDILALFQTHSEQNSLTPLLYEDIPRNSLINNYPDILLAFTIQRMMTEMLPFETALRQLTFCSLPFICDEAEMTGDVTDNNGGTREQLEDDEFEEIGYDEGEGYQREPGPPRGGNQEESEDIDFDDDDFDDIVDDF